MSAELIAAFKAMKPGMYGLLRFGTGTVQHALWRREDKELTLAVDEHGQVGKETADLNDGWVESATVEPFDPDKAALAILFAHHGCCSRAIAVLNGTYNTLSGNLTPTKGTYP